MVSFKCWRLGQNFYVKIVGDEFLTVTNLVNQIVDATGMRTDKIKPSGNQYVAFLSSGESEGVGADSRFSR